MLELNVGLIGGGFMGKAHSLAYAAMPMFYWPAPAMPIRKVVVDVTEELAATAAARYGWENYSTSWQSVVDDPDIHVIDISTPNHLHAEIAIAAAKAGKHILCEKPLASTVEESKAMVDAVVEADVVNAVAFNYRRTPAIRLAKKYIEDGDLGEILNFRGTYLQDWGADPDFPLTWRFQKSIAGSGVVGDIGSHLVDMARYLVGNISSVNSMVSTFIHDRPLPTEDGRTDGPRGLVDVDDAAVTLVKFESGAVGSLEATRTAWGRSNYITFEIHGTQGSVFFNYERRDELQVAFASDPVDRRGFRIVHTGPQHPGGESIWPIAAQGIGYGETFIIQAHEFFSAIASGGKVRPDFADGYEVALIHDAILASGESGDWVAVQG